MGIAYIAISLSHKILIERLVVCEVRNIMKIYNLSK